MDERLGFVARLLEGERMAPLCASSNPSPFVVAGAGFEPATFRYEMTCQHCRRALSIAGGRMWR
jgi:hypothetical protein